MQPLELKPPGPPLEPKTKQILYDDNLIDAETFMVREQNGTQEYALVREPNARPYTKVSLFKTTFFPTLDQYSNLNPFVKKWFK